MEERVLWYKDPYSWLDVDDAHLDHDDLETVLTVAEDHLKDKVVNRPDEWGIFKKLLRKAWKGACTRDQRDALTLEAEALQYGYVPAQYISLKRNTSHQAAHELLRRARERDERGGLTRRQQQALDMHEEAIRHGKPPVTYVAKQLSINKSSASKLLQRAYQCKMETSGPSYAIMRVGVDDWAPSPRLVDRCMKATQVHCVVQGDHCLMRASAQHALCWNCRQDYGAPGERSELTQMWLDPEIARTKRAARDEIVQQLRELHYAGYVIDSADTYMQLTA